MNHGNRVDDLERSLTADQIWLRWLDETTSKFDSHSAYMKWVAQDPRNRLPFPTFDRELTPHATAKTREKASAHRKKLLSAQGTLHFYYCLFRELDDTVSRHSSPLTTLGLEIALRRFVDDSIADLHPLTSVSVPMRREVAATVRTALDNYLLPLRDFRDNLCRWICGYCTETTARGTAPGPEQRLAIWAEFKRDLLEIDAIKWEYYVELEPFPYRSLGAATLVDGRWIDRRLLELAEYAALLRSRGYRLQDPPDNHPLEPLLVENSSGSPPGEQELLCIRNEAKRRLRQLRVRTKEICGQVYVDIEEYRNWAGRAVTGELKPMRGIHVVRWKRRVESLGGEGRAEIAGVKLHRLRAPFGSSDFIACEDETEFARRSETRSLLLEKIHGEGRSAVGGPASLSLLREEIAAALIDLLASRELVKRMEQQFDGHQFVFRKTKERLARQFTSIEKLVAEFNLMSILAEAQGESGSAGLQIDPDSAEISAEERSETMFNTIKLRAEASALESLGRHAAAMTIAAELMAETKAPNTDEQAPPEPKAPDPSGPSVWDRMQAFTDELEREQKAQDDDKED